MRQNTLPHRPRTVTRLQRREVEMQTRKTQNQLELPARTQSHARWQIVWANLGQMKNDLSARTPSWALLRSWFLLRYMTIESRMDYSLSLLTSCYCRVYPYMV